MSDEKVTKKPVMKVYLGEEGLTKSWQKDFPSTMPCVHCNNEARIGFVCSERRDEDTSDRTYVYELHSNKNRDDLWLHDVCAVAVYFCKECLNPTALYNQG